MNGFLCVIKPPGMTSAQVVGRIKRLFPKEKIGHGGTLDPQTAGVLPIMVGRATRLFDYMLDKEKEYIAEVFFGIQTDTQDSQGKVLARSQKFPEKEKVINTLKTFVGEIEQTPPSYSALKVQGKRAYDLARAGEEVVLKPRKIQIYALEPLWYEEPNRFGIKVLCSKGTYIRTLCEDIGHQAGCPAHMSFLLRSKSGAFTLEEGYTLEEVNKAKEEGRLEECLLPLDFPIAYIPKVFLPSSQWNHFIFGRPMAGDAFEPMKDNQNYRLYHKDRRLLGIIQKENERVRLKTYLQGIE